MALTLNQFSGAETGGLEETTNSTGGDATETTIVRSGDRSYVFDLGGTIRFNLFDHVASAGNDHIFGFGIYLTDTTPSGGTVTIADTVTTSNASAGIELRLEANGNLSVLDTGDTLVTDGTITTPFTNGTWHFVEVYFQNLDSGAWEVFVDDVSVASGTGEDFLGGTLQRLNFAGSANLDAAMYIDDFYWLSGATAASDRLGPGVSVLGYQNDITITRNDPDFDSAGVVGGNDLDFGNWGGASERPWGDTNLAAYRASGALNGCVSFNGSDSIGDSPGPASGSDIVSGTIKGAKFVWRGDRSGGGSTVHSIVYGKYDGVGNMDDAPQVDAITLEQGTLINFFVVTETAAQVPTAIEDFVMGIDKGAGGRDWDCYEMQAFLLHVSSTTVTDLSDGLMPEYPSPGLTVEV